MRLIPFTTREDTTMATDGGTAYPTPVTMESNDTPHYSRDTGLSVRDYFAARAPAEVPYWFRHTPAPGRPGEGPEVEDAIGPKPTSYESTVDGTRDAWVARANALSAELEPKRLEHKAAYERWQSADNLAKRTQWAWAWADAMLSSRDETA